MEELVVSYPKRQWVLKNKIEKMKDKFIQECRRNNVPAIAVFAAYSRKVIYVDESVCNDFKYNISFIAQILKVGLGFPQSLEEIKRRLTSMRSENFEVENGKVTSPT